VRLLLLLALALVPVLPHPARQVARLEGAAATGQVAVVPSLPAGRRPRPALPWLRFWVTGYDLTGTTASGAPAGPGVVAVDPGVVPMYAWLQVQGYPGLWRALDTGGLIHGARLDLWFPTLAQCYQATGWRMARWSMRQSDFW
jgi:3D (Asp-Asp-Asp) domain-containing protein